MMITETIADVAAALDAADAPEAATLAERITLLAEDRDEERALKEKLLDPEFTFTGDGMRALDGRGLIQIMVASFDDMMQAQGAANFMTFDIGHPGAPGYVVTVQKATGKTPAEMYMDVARELRDLQAEHCGACKEARRLAGYGSVAEILSARCPEHAAPITPPPDDRVERTPQEGDHVRLDMRRGCLLCERCGREQGFTQPIAGDDLKALMASFGARHRLCRER